MYTSDSLLGINRIKPAERRLGFIATGLVVAALLLDGTLQLLTVPAIAHAASEIGFSTDSKVWRIIGVVLVLSTALYAIPRTAFLGAILITGFLGGTICAHVRIGEGAFAPVIVAFVLATLTWGGLWLRDQRIRTLVSGA